MIAIPAPGGAATSSARAAELTLICKGSGIPSGWVITGVTWTPTCNHNTPQTNAYYITGNLVSGMRICKESKIPFGYVVTQVTWSALCNQYKPQFNMYQISGAISSGMFICMESTIPLGYVITGRSWTAACNNYRSQINTYRISQQGVARVAAASERRHVLAQGERG